MEEHAAQLQFRAGDVCTFMNMETFDQVEVPVSVFSSQAGFLKPEIEVKLLECEGKILGVKFPTSVQLKVVETPPGVKGDTVSRGTKQAKFDTGHVANVPLFINVGDMIKLDTRTGEYLERV
jgi:elongation factor P